MEEGGYTVCSIYSHLSYYLLCWLFFFFVVHVHIFLHIDVALLIRSLASLSLSLSHTPHIYTQSPHQAQPQQPSVGQNTFNLGSFANRKGVLGGQQQQQPPLSNLPVGGYRPNQRF